MSEVRARFLVEVGWAREGEARPGFLERDGALSKFREHDEVVLWFEHDLYDQLQLIQILDWFARRDRGATRLSLIGIDRFPGIARFHGLGELSAEQMATLFPTRRDVSPAELDLGHRAWEAFCEPDPAALALIVASGTSALPFLGAALVRHLEQFPGVEGGLSRTERQVLEAVDEGIADPAEGFADQARREEAPFLGDVVYFAYVDRLGRGPTPLLRNASGGDWVDFRRRADRPAFFEQRIALTDAGRDVLAGRADAVALNGIDRWLGGVHLLGREAAWRWDGRDRRIVGAMDGQSRG